MKNFLTVNVPSTSEQWKNNLMPYSAIWQMSDTNSHEILIQEQQLISISTSVIHSSTAKTGMES